MPGDYLPRQENEYKDWLANFATVVSTHVQELGLSTAQVTAIGNTSAEITADITGIKADKATLRGKIKTKNQHVKSSQAFIRQIVTQIQGNANVPVLLKEQLGINPRDTPRTSTPPVTPTDLVATPHTTGTNSLKWKRADNKPNTRFVIEAHTGNLPFVQVGTTARTKFDHTGQTVGQLVWYRVRAERGNMVSDWTEGESVYGGGSSAQSAGSSTQSAGSGEQSAAPAEPSTAPVQIAA